ncbi:hypothetical protein ACG10_19190 [Azotobacter chroococcum]|jgi:hypothetical protein|nr:hypothetical protein ACG10_19190 [Azotobacter chroococcum]
MMKASAIPHSSSRRFQVRDISAQYGWPTFDLVFHDAESSVVRCSEAIWDSEAQALVEAERLEASHACPVHWEAS